jgi:hypothetical protein
MRRSRDWGFGARDQWCTKQMASRTRPLIRPRLAGPPSPLGEGGNHSTRKHARRTMALSEGRGWTAAGAFTSRSGPGEGLIRSGGVSCLRDPSTGLSDFWRTMDSVGVPKTDLCCPPLSAYCLLPIVHCLLRTGWSTPVPQRRRHFSPFAPKSCGPTKQVPGTDSTREESWQVGVSAIPGSCRRGRQPRRARH